MISSLNRVYSHQLHIKTEANEGGIKGERQCGKIDGRKEEMEGACSRNDKQMTYLSAACKIVLFDFLE